jgi:hypothetical protein
LHYYVLLDKSVTEARVAGWVTDEEFAIFKCANPGELEAVTEAIKALDSEKSKIEQLINQGGGGGPS